MRPRSNIEGMVRYCTVQGRRYADDKGELKEKGCMKDFQETHVSCGCCCSLVHKVTNSRYDSSPPLPIVIEEKVDQGGVSENVIAVKNNIRNPQGLIV